MLDGARDATCDVHLGTNGNACLTNLHIVLTETCVNRRTAGTHFGMNFFCQGIEQLKVLLRAHTITSGNHDRRTLKIATCLFYLAVDNLHDIIRFGHKLRHILDNHFAGIVCIKHFRLHHAATHGSHLRTVFGVNDCRHNITAKSRTDLVKQLVIYLARTLIFVTTNFECRTVGSKS